ncbi:iron transporter [Pontibacter chitinilyticus]|uniref:iron transporter n=1 Tax=Pontibacter chitinilyticus TaxID=2674989 RepID=UPI00321A77A5
MTGYAKYIFLLLFLPLLGLQACVQVAPNLEQNVRVTRNGRATEPQIPLSVVSDESSAEQFQLAKNQGKAVAEAASYAMRQTQSGEMRAGEYQLIYLLEKPKGYYEQQNGKLTWHEPQQNAFLSVAVLDGYDGRIVPGLEVTATVEGALGAAVQEVPLAFGWFPLLHRYGDNISLPSSGNYTIRFHIKPAQFWRHDPVNGDRFASPAMAEFTDVTIDLNSLQDAEDPANEQEWLPLAKEQGRMLERSLDAMIASEAMDGAETKLGDYDLAYGVEFAEGYWRFIKDKLKYKISVEYSAENNAHVEVAPRDALTGRLLPGLQVTTTFFRNGEQVNSYSPMFMWHPWLYHYGQNIRVPGSGNYTLQVQVAPPPYRRYGYGIGNIMAQPITYTFEDVDVVTGQK